MTVVWIVPSDDEPFGVRVPAGPLFEAALDQLVSRASDLMLMSPDVSDGLCIEMNAVPAGIEYELAGWGLFTP